jgi:lysophospholipid hydrolase
MEQSKSIAELISTNPTTDVIFGVTESTIQNVPQQQRSMLAKVFGFVPMLLLKTVGFATISIPLFFYRILTWSFTLHLNFSSLLVILAVIATIAYLIVRYRYLTKYSRLKPINPPKVASSFDLHPDTEEDAEYSKPGYKNYPDEFLSAFLSSIKIFGYLEQPVFHELARHLQTKKLLAGDTLFRNPEQERSFYIVVDGHVQMFVKPDNAENEDDDSDSEEYGDDNAGGIAGESSHWLDDDLEDELMDTGRRRKRDKFRNYTLINEVGAGGTLSSLFTILSIFRESFNRSEAKEKQRQKTAAVPTATRSHQLSRRAPVLSSDNAPGMNREALTDEWRQVFPGLDDPSGIPSNASSRPDSDSSASGLRRRSKTTNLNSTMMPTSDVEDTYFSTEMETHDNSGLLSESFGLAMPIPHRKLSASSSNSQQQSSRLIRPDIYSNQGISRRSYRSVHPNIIARATVDTTLAVIPEEAFHKLTQKFPKAAAHIVQVIVTRFQRVTLMTSHRYLGLTKELLRLEKLVNESASLHELPPNFFVPGGMDRLRRKFNDEEASSEDGDSTLGPSEISRSESSGIIQAIGIIDIPGTPSLHINSPIIGSNNLGTSPTSKGGSPHLIHQKLNRRGEYSMEDDEHLRTSVMTCVSDALGIKSKLPHANQPAEDSSPRSPSNMSPRHTRRFPNDERPRPHYPMDLFSHTGTVDSNNSPSLDPFGDTYYDDDARSTTSSIQSSGNSSDIFNKNKKTDSISPDDIQILYFPKDAVLVREGAHNNGLFFVIDGLLEASMTPAVGEDVLSDVGSHHHKESAAQKKAAKRKSMNRQKSRIIETSFNHGASRASTPDQKGSDPKNAPVSTSAKEDKVLASESPAGRTSENHKDKDDEEKVKKPLFIIKPGGLTGYLDALTGFPSFVEIRAKTDTYVGYLSKKRLDRITDKNPSVMLKLANQLVGHVSPLSKSHILFFILVFLANLIPNFNSSSY